MAMGLQERVDGWWITGADPYHIDEEGPFTDYGPYPNKHKAESDLRGVRRFERICEQEALDGAARR